jgi:hypothetical protein
LAIGVGVSPTTLALLLIAALIASSLIVVNSASAQSITKLSAPQFRLEKTGGVYKSHPTCTTDPYTGENITISVGGVDNQTIEIIIKNPSISSNAYYDIKVRGHYEENWGGLSLNSGLIQQSQSEYTIVKYPIDGVSGNAKFDFKIQAITSHYEYSSLPDHPLAVTGTLVTDAISDWSNIQTISLIDGTVTTAISDQTSSPSVPEFSLLVILLLLAIMPLITIKLLRRK